LYQSKKCQRKQFRHSTCSLCLEQCKIGAITINLDRFNIDSSKCTLCGECIVVCPLSALEGPGQQRKFEKGSLVYDKSYTPLVKELLVYKKKGLKSILFKQELINQTWKENNFYMKKKNVISVKTGKKTG
jgi:Fe-S-cluster-containing hydrogenase component 2